MRIRQHVNPLSPTFRDFTGEKPRLRAGVETEIEIGCADAQFLFERAALEANRNHVGIEIRKPLVDWVNRKAKKLGAPVQSVFCNANRHLSLIFAPTSVDRVFINFPDPWFKKDHHNRRMVNEALLTQVHQMVKPGADIFFQSDVWEVALDALGEFELLDDLFENKAGDWTFWRQGNPYGVRSWREADAEERGLPVWRLMYCRR